MKIWDKKSRLSFAEQNPELAEVSLRSGLPIFQPTHFQGILLNSYDPSSCESAILMAHSRGSKRVCLTEALLTGDVKSDWRLENLYGQSGATLILDSIKGEADYLLENTTLNRCYDLVRIQPYDSQKKDLLDTLSKFQTVAHAESLTFIYITTHGEQGRFAVGGSTMGYGELLDQTDKIRGKKVVVVLGCYGGSLIDEIEKGSCPSDYIALVAAPADALGVNWYEDHLNTMLLKLIGDGKLLSELKGHLPQSFHELQGADPWPIMIGGFDVAVLPKKTP